MSITNEICFEPSNQIIKFTSEGIQTDEIWNADTSSVNHKSEESLIDFSSSFDDSDVSLEKISQFEESFFKTNADTDLIPITLFGNDSSELCKTFCETYKDFFKDVYQEKRKFLHEQTTENGKPQNENSSIHETSIQDNFTKKKIIVEKKLLIKDSTNSGLVLYSSKHYQQQKDSIVESDAILKDNTVSSSSTEYAWSHLDAKTSKINLSEHQIANDKFQLFELVNESNEEHCHGSPSESNDQCLSDDRLLNHLGCAINQGQEKNSAHLEKPDHLIEGILNLQLNLTSGVKTSIDEETTDSLLKNPEFIDEIGYKGTNIETSSELNNTESSTKKLLESKFEASVRLKRLEERINKYTVNKILPHHKNEQLTTFCEKIRDIQISPSIQLESSYSYIANVQELNENAACSKSRVDSCIDFLNFSEKGEISLTPEISIANLSFDKANTLLSSNSAFCETISCNKESENNEINCKEELKADQIQEINQSNTQPNTEFDTVSEVCDKKHFFRDTYDSSRKDEHSLLENKEHDTYEKNETVFQTIHALEGSPSDSEICRIFSKEAIDLTNVNNSELSQSFSSELEPEVNCITRSPTRELTPPKLYTHCEFNARDFAIFNHFLNNNIHECYDELTEEFVEHIEKSHETIIEKDYNANCENSCDCSIEAIPLYNPVLTMRETTMGPIRGLLKKPNRPPTSRKNRVVFDETKNQFFDADYIILIREDCLYDEEEDTEPCTCGEHELVRICCDEGCCGYTDDSRTPPSPKFAPPIEFVDQATLSPPEGYKDAGGNLIDSALQGALGGHVFGAQHIQQLQVIQRLQQQRAAMLAAKAAQVNQQASSSVCVECAECSECAAKQFQEESGSQCSDEVSPACELPIALVPVTNVSPERRIIQKEIVAGEERPRISSPKLSNDNSEENGMEDIRSKPPKPSYILETITMTTVTEHHIIHEAADLEPKQKPDFQTIGQSNKDSEANDSDESSTAKLNFIGSINGILKGGKLRKGDQTQVDDTINTTSDDESSSKRSVRFTEETKEREAGEGESQSEIDYRHPVDYVSHTMKRHSSIFHNALRPNSALRQLFPTTVHPSVIPNSLTDDALKTLDEAGTLSLSDAILSDSDTETIKKTIERNVLRRSLIKYEPKKKLPTKEISSLEERIRQLTCDIDEPLNESDCYDKNKNDYYTSKDSSSDRRDSPTGEETPLQTKFGDKSFSPSSSASSSLSGSVGSTYKKITDLFNRDKRQDRISESEEATAGIVPQDCRCPAGPDLGLGAQIQGGHTQIHQPPPPPPRHPDTRRQFLSTLVPLTACVAGQRDDLSYYTLAQPGNRNSISSSQCTDYSIGDIDKALTDEESKKVAPDVIAGTPGQETDELAAFAQQESNRTEKLKKRYSTENSNSNPGSDDDDEQNDYGFNKRPQVKGIKSRYSTNEILQEMQNQLSQNAVQQPQKAQATLQTQTAQTQVVHSSTLPRPHTTMHIAAKQITAHHQHTASWSYYPDQQASNNNVQQDAHNNYYHLPANARHSYHGHEAVAMQQTITHQPQGQYGKFARSPTRRPESPPPLRNYHQTMVLIPYNSNPYQQFTSTETESTFGRQHNVVEYQQVTQQTIRVPVGYTLPGMQLHVVAPSSHYTSLPRVNNGSKNLQFPTTDQSSINPKFNERGIVRSEPEGAACVQANDVALSPTNNQSQTTNINPQISTGQQKSQPGSVYYAMNV